MTTYRNMATTKIPAGLKEACCIAKVRKEIMEQDENITAVRFDLSTITALVSRDRSKKTGQGITVHYKSRENKRGELRPVKPERTFISHQFCPFCGKKYQ